MVIRGRNIGLWLVFACQAFLDVHHLLKDEVGRAFNDLTVRATNLKANLTSYFCVFA